MEAPLLPPPGLTSDMAALIWLDSYPAGVVRIHSAAGVMRQFPDPPVQRYFDAIGVSMTVTLWHFLIVPDAGALRERHLHGYCLGLIALRARAPRERRISCVRHGAEDGLIIYPARFRGEEELCVWPGPESVLASPARS